MDQMPLFEHFYMYSNISNIYFLFDGDFVLYYSSIVIFLKFLQQPKTQFQFGIISGDELISLQ